MCELSKRNCRVQNSLNLKHNFDSRKSDALLNAVIYYYLYFVAKDRKLRHIMIHYINTIIVMDHTNNFYVVPIYIE